MASQETGSSDPKVVETTWSTSISDKLKNLDPEVQDLVKNLATKLYASLKIQEEKEKAEKAEREAAKREAEGEARRNAKEVKEQNHGDPVVAELLKQVLNKLNTNDSGSTSNKKKEYHHVPFNYPPLLCLTMLQHHPAKFLP